MVILIALFGFGSGVKKGYETDIESHSLSVKTMEHADSLPTTAELDSEIVSTTDNSLLILTNDSANKKAVEEQEAINAELLKDLELN